MTNIILFSSILLLQSELGCLIARKKQKHQYFYLSLKVIPKLTTLLMHLHIESTLSLSKESCAVNRRNLKVLPQTFCL